MILGRILMIHKGDYSDEEQYVKLDSVTKEGSSYLNIQDCKGIDVTDTDHWACIAKKGDKGDKFNYDDFTPEQVAQLQKPATDAAAELQDAEDIRVENETARNSAEDNRISNETTRQSAEITRGTNEDARKKAESSRVTEFGTLKTASETATENAQDAADAANLAAQTIDDKINLRTNSVNLSVTMPTSGVKADGSPGGCYYTLETALSVLPVYCAQVGLQINDISQLLFLDINSDFNDYRRYSGPVASVASWEEFTTINKEIGKEVEKILTPTCFSGILYNGTQYVQSNNKYNSFIIRLSPQQSISYELIAGSLQSVRAFSNRPSIGAVAELMGDVTNPYTNTTDAIIYIIFSCHTDTETDNSVRISMSEIGIMKRLSSIDNLITQSNEILNTKASLTDLSVVEQHIEESKIDRHIYAENVDTYENVFLGTILKGTLIENKGIRIILYNALNDKIYLSKDESVRLSADIVKITTQSQSGIVDFYIHKSTYIDNLLRSEIDEQKQLADSFANKVDGASTTFAEKSDNYINCIIDAPSGKFIFMLDKIIGNHEEFSLRFRNSATSSQIVYENNAHFGQLYELQLPEGYDKIFLYHAIPSFSIPYSETEYVAKLYQLTSFEYRVGKLENIALKDKTILMLGDSITQLPMSGTYTSGKGIVEYVHELTGANVIRGAVGGSHLSIREDSIPTIIASDSNARCSFDVAAVAHALATQNFDIQTEAIEYWNTNNSGDAYSATILENLKNADMARVNIVTIFAGTNDCNSSAALGTHDSYDITTYYGAINQSIKELYEAYPHLTIVLLTPIVRHWNERATATDADWSDNRLNSICAKLTDYCAIVEDASKINHVPYIDMYNGLGINRYNFWNYFPDNDGTHPRKAFDKLGAFIAHQLISKCNR